MTLQKEVPGRRTFDRIKTSRVFEEVCEQIKLKLSAGDLRPGDRLPAERDLAVEFGVGRPAVREALRSLEISGIVETRKGVKGGAFVREGNPAMVTQSLRDLVMLGHITPGSLAEARGMILQLVVRLACERGEEEDFAAIEKNIDEIKRLADERDLVGRAEAAVEFFRLIAKATRNDVMVVLVESLGAIIRYFVVERQKPQYHPELIPIRLNILKYMRAKNTAKALAEVERYLEIVHKNVLPYTDDVDKVITSKGRTNAGARSK
jgi:GntR family transcriptional regulator, transcriptional repressor for pyruvate dehydrogenase complex